MARRWPRVTSSDLTAVYPHRGARRAVVDRSPTVVQVVPPTSTLGASRTEEFLGADIGLRLPTARHVNTPQHLPSAATLDNVPGQPAEHPRDSAASACPAEGIGARSQIEPPATPRRDCRCKKVDMLP